MSTERSGQILHYPGPNIKRQQIANRLNMLHFRGEPLLVVVRHKVYGYVLTLRAVPNVCHGKKLEAIWVKDNKFPRNLHSFTIEKIIVPGISMSLELVSNNIWFEESCLQADIPEQLNATSGRLCNRQKCLENVRVQLFQYSICFNGVLLNCSAEAISLKITAGNVQSFYWLNPEQDLNLILSDDNHIFFSGKVKIIRSEGSLDERIVVVSVTNDQSPRYRPKKKRTKRFSIRPSPDVAFTNPLTGTSETLPVCDISTLGLSLKESQETAVLFPGLILKDINLNIFGNSFLNFTGQVVYRRREDSLVVLGIAILEISVDDHLKLIGLIHRSEDENSYVSLNHDPVKFFEFLFDTGFLYPSKYQDIYSHRETFIEAYKKLYLSNNKLARCFVYLENGQIYGHVSALKIYKHTWLNHHHAALAKKNSGLKVLRQISDFHNDSYVLNPLQMRYIVGIWRPVNNFPARFFGSFSRQINDPQMCSMDTFAYFRVSLEACQAWDSLVGPWEISKATQQDLYEFEGYYKNVSGGLLTSAFDLNADNFDDNCLSVEYEKHGLKRDRYLYAARYGLDLMALVEVQDSDLGLNLSELTNAVYIYILNQEMITPKVLNFICCFISVKHKVDKIAVMLYPKKYAEKYNIDNVKDYTVWILNTECSDSYMQHISRWCR